ncbi:hypothetical protein AVI51_08110 [Piscirickettsia salmonis]|uniref:Uncharacterized protein n=1 Tax=Piscirickettsia salmonis TaxID=1238 RepID=A0A095BBP5_PISSA|nr:hypothetical protein [Piscirickettsia salmonis]AKP73093.1 hypothetical protein PSLF89_1071 [Piscirickettsia salmonis LF-89 = ATCC VR-1361]ALA23971.1 hypothetical protein KW89_502 [Piscirickettsia salmonis]ALB21745.1 hypothetical protein KU39_561 [Piscirickettsia salmonis]ALY01934.1 hypothetical protein AWE47_02840 [Piscirickettsia salmonis]AMA41443.1 hypothetical protein AWJ11_02825 [Piscirickettsia salmonis]
MRKIILFLSIALITSSGWATGSSTDSSKFQQWSEKAKTATENAWEKTKSGSQSLWNKVHPKKSDS